MNAASEAAVIVVAEALVRLEGAARARSVALSCAGRDRGRVSEWQAVLCLLDRNLPLPATAEIAR